MSRVYGDYPPIMAERMPIELWDPVHTAEYMRVRVEAHQLAQKGEGLDCTAEETHDLRRDEGR